MAAATKQQHVQLAQALPQRLLRFFARFPPEIYGHGTTKPPSATAAITTTSTTAPSDPNAPAHEADTTITPPEQKVFSPFAPHKNHRTGCWQGARYGLRRQADLVKLAEKHGVEALLPFSRKLSAERLRRREADGLRVRGTGVGQTVKGHKWERTLDRRLEARKQAMLQMPKMIQEWKQRGHGRGWKKWPKGSSK